MRAFGQPTRSGGWSGTLDRGGRRYANLCNGEGVWEVRERKRKDVERNGVVVFRGDLFECGPQCL